MSARRPNTAARRQQANLAGAGNFLAWAAEPTAPAKNESALTDPSPAPLTRVHTPPSLAHDGKVDSPEYPRLADQRPIKPAFDSKEFEDAPAPATHSSAAPGVMIIPANTSDTPANAVKSKAALDYETHLAADLAYLSSTARAEIEKDHALFLRVLIHRVQETRSIQRMWHEPSSITDESVKGAFKEDFIADEDVEALVGEGWAMPGVAAVPSAAYFLQALRYLQTAAHESVAVDILHAMSGCSGPVSLDAVAVGDGGEEIKPLSVVLVGGLPTYSFPSYPNAEWLQHVGPILETLLYTCYEDYLSVALRVVGHAMDALQPLFDVAINCCNESDLSDNSANSDSNHAMSDSLDGEGIESAARQGMDGNALRCAAREAVKASHHLQPLLAAMRNAAEYGGRIQKLAIPRIERVQQAVDGVRNLRKAWHIMQNGPPCNPSPPPDSYSPSDFL